jgi:hypothetical protein
MGRLLAKMVSNQEEMKTFRERRDNQLRGDESQDRG